MEKRQNVLGFSGKTRAGHENKNDFA